MACKRKGKPVFIPFQKGMTMEENLHDRIPRKESLLPYEDEVVKLNPNLYNSKMEKKTEVDDESLDLYINRVLLSASAGANGENNEQFGIMDVEDGHKTHPDQVVGPHEGSWKDRNKRNRKGDRKGRKNKRSEKMPEKTIEDYIVDCNPLDSNGDSDTLVIPVGEFRKLMLSEIKSKARVIHDYYEYQWNHLQEDRIEAYRNIILWRENARKAERKLYVAEADQTRLKKSLDVVQGEFEQMKKAKRQKRNAAKQRRNNHSVASTNQVGPSLSCTVNSSSSRGKQETKQDTTDR